MVLSLKVLNEDAAVNNFIDIGNAKAVKGGSAKLILQLFQADKKIRYMPQGVAVITIDLVKSDNTVITKTATNPFAQDVSIIEFDLDTTDTLSIISQNLIVKIIDDNGTNYAMLQGGLQMVPLTQSC